ncbi:MAG: DNA primase [Bacteroidales bacterium]|nr:DNA primase [Bacteroidales bacterium]
MISQEDIDRILESAKIEEVVGDFVELKRRGANYVSCCPFHNEDTPSFYVSPARGIFKCFGCGEGGNSVVFLMKYQHYTYPEALRWLAKKYNIEIKEKELSPQEITVRDEKDALFNINEFACKYYYNNLFESEEGQSVGLSYFNERQITRKTIDTWQLGYAKQKGDDFALHALKAGYDAELLVKSGLCLRSEKDGSLYDRFRARVTFPVYNTGGRVLGFSARILTKDKTKAKYVNSPESPIYIKGKTLFGLNFARNEMAKQNLCYLVEGNIDAIMMNQNEVKNTVASSGTALTEDQIKMIKRYTDNVAILYDGDAAGIHAAIRATDMFLKEGMHVSIVLFPDGDDPDSFARKHTQDEFHEFLKTNARNFIIYRANLANAEAEKDPIRKSELIKDIIHSISLIPDLIERTAYIQQCSAILNMKEDILTDQLNKEMVHNAYLKNKEEKKAVQSESVPVKEQKEDIVPQPKSAETSTQEDNIEKNLIRILVNYAQLTTDQPVLINNKVKTQPFNAGGFILNDVVSNDININNPVYKEIFDLYFKYYKQNNQMPEADSIIGHCSEQAVNVLTELLMSPSKITVSQGWEKYGMIVPDINSSQIIDKDIKYTLLSAKLYKLSVMMNEIKQQMLNEPQNDALTQTFIKLTVIRNNIAKELNRTAFMP